MLREQVLIDQEICEAELVQTHEGTLFDLRLLLGFALVFDLQDLRLVQLIDFFRSRYFLLFRSFVFERINHLLHLLFYRLWLLHYTVLCHHLDSLSNDLGCCGFLLFFSFTGKGSSSELARCSDLDEGVLSVDIPTFAPRACIDLITDIALEKDADDWHSLAKVAHDTLVNNLRLLSHSHVVLSGYFHIVFLHSDRLELAELFAHNFFHSDCGLLADHTSQFFERCSRDLARTFAFLALLATFIELGAVACHTGDCLALRLHCLLQVRSFHAHTDYHHARSLLQPWLLKVILLAAASVRRDDLILVLELAQLQGVIVVVVVVTGLSSILLDVGFGATSLELVSIRVESGTTDWHNSGLVDAVGEHATLLHRLVENIHCLLHVPCYRELHLAQVVDVQGFCQVGLTRNGNDFVLIVEVEELELVFVHVVKAEAFSGPADQL